MLLARLLTVVLLLFSALSILFNNPAANDRAAFACTCIEIKPADEALAESGAVFSGRIDGITVNEEQYSKIATFTIDRAWKGIPENKTTVLVKTGINGGLCGYPFEEGRSYLSTPMVKMIMDNLMPAHAAEPNH